MEKASFWARLGAFVIDITLIMMVILLPYLLDGARGSLFFILGIILLVFALRDSVKGQSLGKFILGIGVRDRSDPRQMPSVLRRFLRNLSLNRITGTNVYRIVERKRSVVLLSILAVLALPFLVSALIPARTPLTAEEFISRMEEAGFTVSDGMQHLIEIDAVESELGNVEAVLRVSTEYFILEFYVFSTEARARMSYGTMRDGAARPGASHTEVSLSNFSRFTQVGGERYIVVSRIDNTVLFAYIHSLDRAWMDDFLRMLGY